MDPEARRKRLNLTYQQLADAAGLGKDAVHAALRGTADTRNSTLNKINAALVRLERAAVRALMHDMRPHTLAEEKAFDALRQALAPQAASADEADASTQEYAV